MIPLRCTAAAVAVLVAAASAPADWPVFRGDPRMTGVADAKLPDQLEERWTFKCKDSIESAPAIVDGVAYVASMDKHVYAVELATGNLKWKVQLGRMKAAPAVHKGRVYVGDVDGVFHCRDAADGKPVWTFDTGGEVAAGANFHPDGVLVGSFGKATLYCLTYDGKPKWEFKVEGGVNGSVAVVGDRTFCAGCDSLLHVLDVPTGKEVGSVDLAGQAAATAAVADGHVYVGTMTNQVVAVKVGDGAAPQKAWEFEAPRRQQPFYASAAVTGDAVVTGSRDQKVYALDRATGKEKWNFATEGMVDCSPVVVGGRVYVGTLDDVNPNFFVLDLATGKPVQQLTLNGAVTGSPAVGPDCVLIGTDKGVLYCLGKK